MNKSLFRIFLQYFISILLLNLFIFYLLDFDIVDNIEKMANEEILSIVENRFLFLTISISVFHLLLMRKFALDIQEEIDKIDRYLDEILRKKSKPRRLQLSYSSEFREIGKKLSRVFQEIYKISKKRRQINSRLKLTTIQQEQLLRAISHELKNPIAVILGYSQILESDISDTKQLGYIQKVISNTKRMDRLLNRLRLAVQLENRKFRLEYSSFDMADVIYKVVDEVAGYIPNRNINLDISPYQVYGDRTLMELVAINLIENGLKYSKGDILVILKEDYLRVIDFGIGIEKSKMPSITKKFYRVNRKSHKDSMGLGLAIVNYILKLHKLELEIESELGKGSTFSIKLLPIKYNKLPKGIETISSVSS